MRRTRDGYGLDTGRFGHWLYTARWVRAGVAVVAVLVLWANRPLNVFLIVFTVVIAALVLLATLLWRTVCDRGSPWEDSVSSGIADDAQTHTVMRRVSATPARSRNLKGRV